ncbi:hypothetical protein BCEN4_320050 [Burkholderia cenocepacia]|nr:hypothetical protein BCEN4_320050 [Burkholderia cenocepacia]
MRQARRNLGKLRVCVAVLSVEILPRFPETVRILDNPGPQRDHANEQLHARVGQLVFDSRGHLLEIVAEHQAITLELS